MYGTYYVQFLSRVRLWDPMNCSPLGSSVHGISQARILEWGCHFLLQDLPDPGMEPVSPASAAGFFTTEPPAKSMRHTTLLKKKKKLHLLCTWNSNLPGHPVVYLATLLKAFLSGPTSGLRAGYWYQTQPRWKHLCPLVVTEPQARHLMSGSFYFPKSKCKWLYLPLACAF